MKLKKYSYLIVLILILLIGINGVEAKVNKTCYYMASTKESTAILKIKDGSTTAENFWPPWNIFDYDNSWDKRFSEVRVNKLGTKIDNDTEAILNWYENEKDEVTGMTLNAINSSTKTAKKSNTCPEYLIVRTNNKYTDYETFATNSKSIATQLVDKSNATGKYKTWYLTYKNADGSEITSEDYYGTFITTNDYDNTPICDPATMTEEELEHCISPSVYCEQFFGDKNDDGDKNDVNGDGAASLAYLVDSVLAYVRIIVPILIILLGVIDFAKAVISSDENKMREAQLTFVKRLILGVVVFFVPLIVNIIMELTDTVWDGLGYSVCEFR